MDSINEPVRITLKAGEWMWLLGLLSASANQGENRTLDKLYDQVLEAIDDLKSAH